MARDLLGQELRGPTMNGPYGTTGDSIRPKSTRHTQHSLDSNRFAGAQHLTSPRCRGIGDDAVQCRPRSNFEQLFGSKAEQVLTGLSVRTVRSRSALSLSERVRDVPGTICQLWVRASDQSSPVLEPRLDRVGG